MTPRSQQVPKRSYEPHQSQAGATQSQKRKPATAQSPFQSSFGPTPTPSTSATTSTPFKRARIKQINNKREDAFHWTTTPSQRDAQHSIAGRQFDLPSLQSPRRSLLDGSHLTLTHSQSQNPSQSANEGQPLSTLQSRAVPLLSNPPSVAENQSPEKKKKGRRAQPVSNLQASAAETLRRAETEYTLWSHSVMRSASLAEDLEQRCAKLRVEEVLSPVSSSDLMLLLRASLLSFSSSSSEQRREGLVLLRPKTKGVITTCTVGGVADHVSVTQTAHIGHTRVQPQDQVWLLEWHSVTLHSGEEALLSSKYAVVH